MVIFSPRRVVVVYLAISSCIRCVNSGYFKFDIVLNLGNSKNNCEAFGECSRRIHIPNLGDELLWSFWGVYENPFPKTWRWTLVKPFGSGGKSICQNLEMNSYEAFLGVDENPYAKTWRWVLDYSCLSSKLQLGLYMYKQVLQVLNIWVEN
jgi:hypothetical protein